MFASTIINYDPLPWFNRGNGMRISDMQMQTARAQGLDSFMLGWTYLPRPELAEPQHNPANPILVAFRSTKDEHWSSPYWLAVGQRGGGDGLNWTAEHAAHAHKVLLRYAALVEPELYDADPANVRTDRFAVARRELKTLLKTATPEQLKVDRFAQHYGMSIYGRLQKLREVS